MEVGAQVYEFKKGDGVAGFYAVSTLGGSDAEYAIAKAHTTFHLPERTSLNLPESWNKSSNEAMYTASLVYGGATAVGAFTIKLARKSGIRPIIAVKGRGAPVVESLLDSDKYDIIINYYRKCDVSVVKEVKSVLGGRKLLYSYEAVSEKSSFENILTVLEPEGKIRYVLPRNSIDKAP
ncbi:quinone oxidoreductase [Colletotrichum incanum]|nr:quinone oxidoreductase [Colletotrichum incanum]